MSNPALDPRKYVRILIDVRDRITCGDLPSGKPVPNITSMCRDYECTRQTVSKAYHLLSEDGYVTFYPGLGYYVARGPAVSGTISVGK